MKELDYDLLIQDALKQVVKEALKIAAIEGLHGDHHFYITFRTDRNDVKMPKHLRDQHPDEVTIVLQHQFWDLKIEENKFSVTLSFHGKHETLVVPYSALISFMDPSVKFGLQFSPDEPSEEMMAMTLDSEGELKSHKPTDGKNNVVTLDSFRKKK